MKITTKNGHQFLFGPEAAASARWLLGSFRGDASARMFGRPTLGPFLFGKNNDLMWHFGSHGIDYADQLDEFVAKQLRPLRFTAEDVAVDATETRTVSGGVS